MSGSKRRVALHTLPVGSYYRMPWRGEQDKPIGQLIKTDMCDCTVKVKECIDPMAEDKIWKTQILHVSRSAMVIPVMQKVGDAAFKSRQDKTMKKAREAKAEKKAKTSLAMQWKALLAHVEAAVNGTA